jgi:TP901-1 family phage major tail protein
MAMNGSDVLVLVNTGTPTVPAYEVMGSQRDVTFEEATEEIDVSSKSSRAKQVLPGRYSSTVSLDALYVPTDDAYKALKDAMRDGELILVARQENGVTVETADALITSLSEAAPDQGECTVSISMTVDGFWTEMTS